MTTATLGTCSGCGLGLTLPHRAPWHAGQRVVVFPKDQFEQYFDSVAKLIDQLSTLDPNGREEKHPDWPLQLRGDEDACIDFCKNMTELERLHKAIADSPNSELRSPISDSPRP